MTFPTSSTSPGISHPESFSGQGTQPSGQTSATSSEQRQQGDMPLAHANQQPTAHQFQAKHQRSQQATLTDTQQATLADMPTELFIPIIERLPEHGPYLAAIARATKNLYKKTSVFVQNKVNHAIEVENELKSELMQSAANLDDVPDGISRLEKFEGNLNRAKKGLIQRDYLEVLYASVVNVHDLASSGLIQFSDNFEQDIDLVKAGLDHCIKAFQEVKPMKGGKEGTHKEAIAATIESMVTIAEALLMKTGHLCAGRSGLGTAYIESVIDVLSSIASHKETVFEGGTKTEIEIGREVVGRRITSLTRVFQDLLKQMARPDWISLQRYRNLSGFRIGFAIRVRGDIALEDHFKVEDICKFIEATADKGIMNFSELYSLIEKIKTPALKNLFRENVALVEQLDDKQGYVITRGNIASFLQKILSDDKSKKNFVESMTRSPGSEGAGTRSLSVYERQIIQRVIDSMTNPELKKEANNLLSGETTLQRLGKSFGSLMPFR